VSVECRKWLGICDGCGEESPELRDSFADAQTDADSCECRFNLDPEDGAE